MTVLEQFYLLFANIGKNLLNMNTVMSSQAAVILLALVYKVIESKFFYKNFRNESIWRSRMSEYTLEKVQRSHNYK